MLFRDAPNSPAQTDGALAKSDAAAQSTRDADIATRPFYLFMTPRVVTGNIGGIEGANRICQALADASTTKTGGPSPLGSKRFVALIDGKSQIALFSGTNPSGPIRSHIGGRALPYGTVFSTSPDALAGLGLSPLDERRLSVDQNGDSLYRDTGTALRFWRGSTSGGDQNCNDWTSSAVNGGSGDYVEASGGVGTVTCAASNHLLCVEVDTRLSDGGT